MFCQPFVFCLLRFVRRGGQIFLCLDFYNYLCKILHNIHLYITILILFIKTAKKVQKNKNNFENMHKNV